MKEKLEKIVSSAIETGKKFFNHIKKNAKVYTLMGAVGVANAGKLDIWNSAVSESTNENVDIYDVGVDSPYMPTSEKVHIYLTDDPNGINGLLKGAGINSSEFFSKKSFLTADNNLGDNSNNWLNINYMGPIGGDISYTPLNTLGRNIVLRQDLNSPSPVKDDHVYDLVEMTNEFTQRAWINLPDITSSTPRSPEYYDVWEFISTNNADINFDGKVNLMDFSQLAPYWNTTGHGPQDNWANFADINRDGNVDLTDLVYMTDNWLWDGTQ